MCGFLVGGGLESLTLFFFSFLGVEREREREQKRGDVWVVDSLIVTPHLVWSPPGSSCFIFLFFFLFLIYNLLNWFANYWGKWILFLLSNKL